MNLNLAQQKVMWIIGACERLASLGLLSKNVPAVVTQEAIDNYLEIDENRNYLFENDYEVVLLFRGIVDTLCEPEIDDETFYDVVELLLEYKNNRDEVVKYALSHALV